MELAESAIVLQHEEELKQLKKKEKKEVKNHIQFERTRTAFERLQIAWIRASLTLITIGVGAYEYFHNRIESGKAPLLKLVSGPELGLFLILTAFVILLLATIQHEKSMSFLKKQYEGYRFSVASLLSFLILFLATFLVVMVLRIYE
jgi:uncharacterized membrane protein YidH (DUF202 family)